ncbi:hypothetical protein AB0E69_29835 [Kribbella sp. NPDC026611]|uniref:hypothetical protein n=1 Tax=Kribbella sp. NPDC026611 TaxID=3154911 RepID=UPI0033DDF0CD
MSSESSENDEQLRDHRDPQHAAESVAKFTTGAYKDQLTDEQRTTMARLTKNGAPDKTVAAYARQTAARNRTTKDGQGK